jgi:hypothetical protein
MKKPLNPTKVAKRGEKGLVSTVLGLHGLKRRPCNRYQDISRRCRFDWQAVGDASMWQLWASCFFETRKDPRFSKGTSWPGGSTHIRVGEQASFRVWSFVLRDAGR